MKQFLKRALFSILGKDPDPVILTVSSSEPLLARMRALVPHLPHIVVEPGDAPGPLWLRLRRAIAHRRVALCAVEVEYRPALVAALAACPGTVLAFDRNGDRHHLHPRSPLASLLFACGVPYDRIFLRPRWLVPWKRDRSTLPTSWRTLEGRPFRPGKPRVAVLSPYLPWPLSHGGAVRIWNLLREASANFDILLFAFEDGQSDADLARAAEICSLVAVAAKPRYREPRWSSLLPPETCEFYTPQLHSQLNELLARHNVSRLQVEYTQLARYGGHILVEHDVTQDLFSQLHRSEPSLSTWWDLFRWRRFENLSIRRYPAIVAMSEKDAALIGQPAKTTVIPNGVDLARFQPTPRPAHPRLLFIGSFRHFPNVRAYQFLTESIWPLLETPGATLTVVAGPHPELYWPHPSPHPRIHLHGFVADVKPLYDEAAVVVIPTTVSAGTNLKALEAMAMRRPIVSTPSGVAGLGLTHGQSVLIAESPREFAAAVDRLFADPALAEALAAEARRIAERDFAWPALARLQEQLWLS